MTKKKLVPNPRCHAHKKTGEQCRNQSLNGMTVCKFHGGGTWSSREAARNRLLAAADPAAAVVIDIANNPRAALPVRLAAAKDILDRVDLSGRSVIQVEVDIDPGLMEMVRIAQAEALAEQAARPALHGAVGDVGLMGDVIDAELADDDLQDEDGYLDLSFSDAE